MTKYDADALYLQPANNPRQIAPNKRQQGSYAVAQTVKDIIERMLKLELNRAIEDLGPQKAAQVVVNVFRLKGLPKELRRHL
jgi:hypothetical protein